MGLLVRVKDWTSGAGEGAAREAEVLANGLSDDISTCVQDAGSYRGIHIWYKALEHGGPIHHGNSRQADVVLEGDFLISELTGICTFNVAFPIPSV